MSNNIIPVGSLVPLSGPSAIDGGEFRKGLLLAVEEINERGGILGRPIVPVAICGAMKRAGVKCGRSIAASRVLNALSAPACE